MTDQHFLSASPAPDVFGPLHGGERVMWRGRCGVAEYAFDQAASMPRWTLPESTDVLVTDRRVRYAYTAESTRQVRSGELRWLWPQHLRVQPGARSSDRRASATQIQLVCGGDDGSYPALVLAGGDLASVGDADRLANVMRQAIARFRMDNAGELGLTSDQMRMLSRLAMGPEFRNHQGGEGQTATLLGALAVARPSSAAAPVAVPVAEPAPAVPPAPAPAVLSAPAPAVLSAPAPAVPLDPAPTVPLVRAPAPAPAVVSGDHETEHRTRLINYRPGRAADAARALMAVQAEQEAQRSEPDIASRAAALAARVAELMSEPSEPSPSPLPPLLMRQTSMDGPGMGDGPTTNLAERAERIRRSAARMTGNSARAKAGIRRTDQDAGTIPRVNRGG